MNRMTTRNVLGALLLPAILAACTSNGYRKADDTATRMSLLRADIQGMDGDLASLQASLKDVMQPSTAGTEAAYSRFATGLAEMRKRASAAESGLKSVKDHARDYFAAWETDIAKIKDGDVRDRAEARRQDLMRQHDDVARSLEDVRPEYRALIDSLEDLRIYLSNDLSSAGLESLRGAVDRVDGRAKTIRNRLGEVVAVIERTSPGFTPAYRPTETTPEKKAVPAAASRTDGS